MSKRKINISPDKPNTGPNSKSNKKYYTDDDNELLKDVFTEHNTMFFDNDPHNFEGFKNSINFLINDSIPNELIRNYIDPKKRSWREYMELKTNRNRIPFAKKMKMNNDEKRNNEEEHDADNFYTNALVSNKITEICIPVEGFDKRHIDIVNAFIKAHDRDDAPLYLIFDWDRTLSVCEGVLFLPDDYNELITENDLYHDMLKLLMGGEKRFLMLKKFFTQICKTPKLQILVITANPSAEIGSETREKFLNMLQLLIPSLTKDRFLYSSSKSSKFIEFNKYISQSKPASTKHTTHNSKKTRNNLSTSGGRKNRTKKHHK